jgi:hypothetical protein
MTLDYEVRHAAAKWARTVSLEATGTPSHAERLVLAKRVCEGMSDRDGIMGNLILLVRMFLGTDNPEAPETEAMLGTILDIFVVVGAYQ